MARVRAGDVVVRPVASADADAITRIYNHYVTETIVTFEEELVGVAEMGRRIGVVTAASYPYYVADVAGVVAGYAYASVWKPRSAYRFSTEVTVYLAPGASGQGIGSALYTQLLSTLHNLKFHAAMGGISLPNDASIALHEKHGFRKVAHFEEQGYKFGKWIDVGYWQRLL